MCLTHRLDKLMKEKGINRMELSKNSGIPYTTIVNFYEKGTKNIKLATLLKLSEYLSCSIDYLVGKCTQVNDINPTVYASPPIEHELFIKEFLSAPKQCKKDIIYFWNILKDAEAGRQHNKRIKY